MPIGGSINQVTQIGVETTKGTVVPATRRLLAMGVALSDEFDVGSTRPRGQKYPSAHPLNRRWGAGDIDGNPAFNEMQYALSSILAKSSPAPRNLIGTRANSTAYALGDVIASGTRLYRATTAGTSAATPPAALGTTTTGQTVTDGTVVWTDQGVSSGVTAYEWIFTPSSTQKDDVATFTVEQIDFIRNRAFRSSYCMFNEMSIESSRSDEISLSGSIVSRELTRGVTPTTPLSMPAPAVMTPAMVNVYLDTSSANFGTTKLAANFGYSLTISDRFNQAWVHDRSLASWSEHLESEPSVELELTIAEDAVTDTILANAIAGQRMFVRFECIGTDLGGGIKNTFIFDMAAQISDSAGQDDEDDAFVLTIPMAAEHDDTWGKAMQAKLINSASAL